MFVLFFRSTHVHYYTRVLVALLCGTVGRSKAILVRHGHVGVGGLEDRDNSAALTRKFCFFVVPVVCTTPSITARA